MREGSRILNFMTKLEVTFDADLVYRILASPQWVSQDSLLPADPGITVLATAKPRPTTSSSPCPEIPLDPQLDAWDQEDAAAADLAKALPSETPDSPPRPSLRVLLRNCCSNSFPDRTSRRSPCDRHRKPTENSARNKRENHRAKITLL